MFPQHTPPTFSLPAYPPNFMFFLCVSQSLTLLFYPKNKKQKEKRKGKGKLKQKPTKEPMKAVSILRYIPVMLVGRDIELRLCQELANTRLRRQLIYYAFITPHPYIIQKQP